MEMAATDPRPIIGNQTGINLKFNGALPAASATRYATC